MESLSQINSQSWLVWFLRGILIFVFLILFARSFDLQIIRGDYFRDLAEGNRVRRVAITAPRGKIIARGGETLVGNKEIKKVVVFEPEAGYQKSEETEGFSEDEIITEWVRDYKMGERLGHISGYVGEVNEDELGKVKAECPEKGPRTLGGFVGRTGLEEQYDCLLTGIDGEELVEVDAGGRKIRSLGRRSPVPGQDLVITIDFGLQEKVSKTLDGKKGGVVVTDPMGEILAFYSSPSYDPNIFTDKKKSLEIKNILENAEKPLFNRLMGGTFHPGSVYKPLVAIAALEEGKIDKNYRYDDTGQITIDTLYGNFSYKNWYFTQYGGTEGNIDLARALARSTDTFFYKVGELTGVENLDKWSQKFGLDKKTGIDLPGEIAGLVPNPEWKLKVKGERWFLGNTYHLAIGQGDLAVTPLSLNIAIVSIPNGGKLCKPHLVSETELVKIYGQDTIGDKFKCADLEIDEKNIEYVTEGMMQTCESGGTAYTFFDFKDVTGKSVACKTGTAQTENGDPHAWFTVFSANDDEMEAEPIENNIGVEKIVATVLVENGGEGSRVAGPIAREIFNYWYKVTPSVTPQAESVKPIEQTPTPADET